MEVTFKIPYTYITFLRYEIGQKMRPKLCTNIPVHTDIMPNGWLSWILGLASLDHQSTTGTVIICIIKTLTHLNRIYRNQGYDDNNKVWTHVAEKIMNIFCCPHLYSGGSLSRYDSLIIFTLRNFCDYPLCSRIGNRYCMSQFIIFESDKPTPSLFDHCLFVYGTRISTLNSIVVFKFVIFFLITRWALILICINYCYFMG